MKDYKVNGKVVEMTLENGKVVKCATEWVEKTMKALNIAVLGATGAVGQEILKILQTQFL